MHGKKEERGRREEEGRSRGRRHLFTKITQPPKLVYHSIVDVNNVTTVTTTEKKYRILSHAGLLGSLGCVNLWPAHQLKEAGQA